MALDLENIDAINSEPTIYVIHLFAFGLWWNVFILYPWTSWEVSQFRDGPYK